MYLDRWITALIGAAYFGAVLMTGRAQQTPAGADQTKESHLRDVRQLTFGGENAEAYFSSDDRQLIFQAHEGNEACDQMFIMNADGSNSHRVSNGKGRTTCGFFFPDGKRILYSSTYLAGEKCPPKPD